MVCCMVRSQLYGDSESKYTRDASHVDFNLNFLENELMQ